MQAFFRTNTRVRGKIIPERVRKLFPEFVCFAYSAFGALVPGRRRQGIGKDFFVRRGAEPTANFVYAEATQRNMTEKDLPRGLLHAGDLAFVSQLTEADTADAVVAQIGVGTAADLAAVVAAAGELRLSLLLQNHRSLSHLLFLLN